MSYILSRPFLPLCVGATLIFSVRDPFRLTHLWISFAVLGLLLALYYLFSKTTKIWILPLWAFAFAICSLIQGIHLQDQHDESIPDRIILHDVSARIEGIQFKQGRCILQFSSDQDLGNIRYLVYLDQDSLNQSMLPGDVVRLDAILFRPQVAHEFDLFDYRAYMDRNHIRYVDFSNAVICDHRKIPNKLLERSAYQAKRGLIRIFENNIPNSNHSGLMSALILGEKSGVDQEIRLQFTNTGTAHILAVSGMHLGIVYALVKLMMLWLLRKIPGQRWILPMINLTAIWAFAWITGMEAAVLRAAVMFSFIDLGVPLRRQSDPVNILACSAFVLMLMNPCIIHDIGFQLSICAVLSIILFEPYFEKILKTGNAILNYLAKIISVSLAVQILITPVSILYFSSFPLYFILGNLIWIPLSFVLMILGFGMLGLEMLHESISKFVGVISGYFLDFGLWSFEQILRLPFAGIQNLPLFEEHVFILMIGFIGIKFWLETKGMRLLYLAFICFIAFAVSYPIRKIYYHQSTELMVYQSKKPAVFEIKHGDRMYSFRYCKTDKEDLSKFSKRRLIQSNTIVCLEKNKATSISMDLEPLLKKESKHKKNQTLRIQYYDRQTGDYCPVWSTEKNPDLVIFGPRCSVRFQKSAESLLKDLRIKSISLRGPSFLQNINYVQKNF